MNKLIKISIEWLQNEGYSIVNTAKGIGVPAYSRLNITKGNQTYRCIIKRSNKQEGRISFTRNDDGTWKVLSDCDRVLYIGQHPDGLGEIKIYMFDAKTIEQAFDKTYDALLREGNENYEIWLSPNKEKSTRFLGSGYVKDALCSETIPALKQEVNSSQTTTTNDKNGLIAEFKSNLAHQLGLSEELIQVEIKISSV